MEQSEGTKPISDRLKRDEWSEGAVATLLEAYEAKWVLRNRAKLKGHDWDDVARQVSSRGAKSPKTLTQCKNKIESMKKRYRSESASDAPSSWPLYPRLDLLLRGPPPPLSLILVDPPPLTPSPPVLPSNGADHVLLKEEGVGAKLSEKVVVESDSSTPAVYIEKENPTRTEDKRKKRRREQWEIGESIRLMAEVMVRSEQARMETMKELERMRVEAEAKRGEMELKRTEIIASTQLEIARLIASKPFDSSVKITRN